VPAAEPVARTEPKIAPVASPVGPSPEPIARPATHAHRPEPRAAAERTEPRIPVSNGSANAATPAGNFSSADVERVYTQYLAARAKNSERTDNVKRETVEKTIRAMLPQLEQKHAGKKIDFDVVVKDGKVALKPITK
jgi:hypothetical protein